MKKHCWIIRSSPREENDFFCKLTQNTLLTGVFLVLPKIHSLDARVSLEERFVKCRMHKRKHFTEKKIFLQAKIGVVVISVILDENANLGLIDENMIELSNILRPYCLQIL